MAPITPIATTTQTFQNNKNKQNKINNNKVEPSGNMKQVVTTYQIQRRSLYDNGWVQAGTILGIGAVGLLSGRYAFKRIKHAKEDIINAIAENNPTRTLSENIEAASKAVKASTKSGNDRVLRNLNMIYETIAELPKMISEVSIAEREKYVNICREANYYIAEAFRSTSAKGRTRVQLWSDYGQDLSLSLKDGKNISLDTHNKIQQEIANSLEGHFRKRKMNPEDMRVLNISYEGPSGHKAGGQYDIATQLPDALTKNEGIKTFNVAPAITGHKTNPKTGAITQFGVQEKDGKLVYSCPEKLMVGNKTKEENRFKVVADFFNYSNSSRSRSRFPDGKRCNRRFRKSSRCRRRRRAVPNCLWKAKPVRSGSCPAGEARRTSPANACRRRR